MNYLTIYNAYFIRVIMICVEGTTEVKMRIVCEKYTIVMKNLSRCVSGIDVGFSEFENNFQNVNYAPVSQKYHNTTLLRCA